jgi:hypothetical protein
MKLMPNGRSHKPLWCEPSAAERGTTEPAIYINCYGTGYPLRDAANALFEQARREKFDTLTAFLLPYLNAMSDKYDFTWEREWRVSGHFEFELKDLVCVVLPPDADDAIIDRFARRGIPAISPEWNYERIVAEFATQQRKTKEIITELREEAAAPVKKSKR